MIVTFIDQSEKNALKKTRRVLDAFANRIGDNTWQTIITQEGLDTVKRMLRQSATRSTAVSCHWIRSRSRSQFLWVVGNKRKFNSEGVVAVNWTEKDLNYSEQFNHATPMIKLLAQLAGLFHDIGKSNDLFQKKLDPSFKGKKFEPYRHDWISVRLFQAVVGQQTDEQWLTQLVNINNEQDQKVLDALVPLQDGVVTCPQKVFKSLPPLAKLVAWLIVSHHRIPQYPKAGNNKPQLENIDDWLDNSFEACWNSPQSLMDDWKSTIYQSNWSFSLGTPFQSTKWQDEISTVAENILKDPQILHIEDWFKQLYIMHLSRLSLMLADHYYSSQKDVTKQWQDRNYHAYANTDKDEQGNKYKKQKLDEHNIAVGQYAREIADGLLDLKKELPHLTKKKSLSKATPSEYKKEFGWQDKAYDLTKGINQDSEKYGFFGINMASTGKGKTRANARIMYGLSNEKDCRFSIALGLRTLTLQTGSALAKDLDLDKTELATLIGSQTVTDLHQQEKSAIQKISMAESLGSESAGSLLKDELDVISGISKYHEECAEWLKHDPKVLKLIQSPVLVSTIDYLIPATDGLRGGRQIAPMLRLLTSDLILDEPDDFGIKDLPALCRLVNWAGMLGSRVLLSTATLSPVQAEALFCAYQAGRLEYTKINGELGETGKVCCAWFDEFKKPISNLVDTLTKFKEDHSQFVNDRIDKLKKRSEKAPLNHSAIVPLMANETDSLQPLNTLSKEIHNSIQKLHLNNAITLNDKKISIGLVRMANINPLVAVAKELLDTPAPENTCINYCIYHSQYPLLQRSTIERNLDLALTRKDFESWKIDSGIAKRVQSHQEKHHIFVVLASPVAEVGRDHDYDWAVVEPSSMRSIIQLAGRVQRHRRISPTYENIHILNKNYKSLKGEDVCFSKPGFESDKRQFFSHDLKDLIEEKEFKLINAIPRIETPTYSPSSFSDFPENPKFKRFNELEHYEQKMHLFGSDTAPSEVLKHDNHASLWWKYSTSWCGEIQRLQPFRQSQPNNEYCRFYNDCTNSFIWGKKDTDKRPACYQNTDDIQKKEQQLSIHQSNQIWFEFDLKQEIELLSEKLSVEVTKEMYQKYTHLSLRRLNTDKGERWQYHRHLGIFKELT